MTAQDKTVSKEKKMKKKKRKRNTTATVDKQGAVNS